MSSFLEKVVNVAMDFTMAMRGAFSSSAIQTDQGYRHAEPRSDAVQHG